MQACRSSNWLHFKVKTGDLSKAISHLALFTLGPSPKVHLDGKKVKTVRRLSALKLGSSVDLNELGELQKQASMFQKILESHLPPFLTSS